MKNEFEFLNDVKMDFSDYEAIELTDTERDNMKKAIKQRKKISINKVLGIAACVALAAVLSQTAFAQSFIGRIVKSVSTGHNTFYQMDNTGAEAELPEAFDGLLYDADGKPAKTFVVGAEYYDKDGNKIEDTEKYLAEHVDKEKLEYEDENVKVSLASGKSEDPLEHTAEMGYPVIKNIDEIAGYLCFAPKLPGYLPEGYSFYGASAYGEEYLFVYYKNEATGNYFSVHERIINDETAFEAGTDGDMYETEINGNKAVVYDGSSVDWEEDGISVGISSRGGFSEEELIKVALSVK
ncbi:MAG: DUF4367 domain-containing protein [Clostridia bacterium]|nr:DUF4367 domain-containing protein [Clostridia bacterium]